MKNSVPVSQKQTLLRWEKWTPCSHRVQALNSQQRWCEHFALSKRRKHSAQAAPMVRIRMYVAASYPATSITSSCFILYTATIQDSSPRGRRLGRRCTPLRLYLRVHEGTRF